MMYERIPQELKDLNQWVACKSNNKIPMDVIKLKGASSSDASTWHSFQEAVDAVNWHLFDYLGFVFNGNDYIGIDIDKGYTDGLLNELSCDIINHCQSYTEQSKSGRGVHIILKGKLPFDGKNNFEGVEIYQSKRFFVMTGEVVVYDTIIENQSAIDYVVDKYFSNIPEQKINEKQTAIYKPKYNSKHSFRVEYPPIIEGGRNLSLLSIGGSLRNAGYNDEQLLNELLKINNIACKPPLPDREVRSVWKSCIKYKRG